VRMMCRVMRFLRMEQGIGRPKRAKHGTQNNSRAEFLDWFHDISLVIFRVSL